MMYLRVHLVALAEVCSSCCFYRTIDFVINHCIVLAPLCVCRVLCVCVTPAVCVLGFFFLSFFFLFFSFFFPFFYFILFYFYFYYYFYSYCSFIVLVTPRSDSCLWGSEVIRLCMLLCWMSSFRCSFSFLRFPRYCCTWRTLLAFLVLFLRGDGRWVPLGLLQFLSPHILL